MTAFIALITHLPVDVSGKGAPIEMSLTVPSLEKVMVTMALPVGPGSLTAPAQVSPERAARFSSSSTCFLSNCCFFSRSVSVSPGS